MSQPLSECFTDRARKVFQLANDEASRMNHEYIGTEHVLLGLVDESYGVASQALLNLGLDPQVIRQEVENRVECGTPVISYDMLPQTARTQRVIEYSIDEARRLDHSYVGTEHILLGLLREQSGVAAGVLTSLGISLEQARLEVQRILAEAEQDSATDMPPQPIVSPAFFLRYRHPSKLMTGLATALIGAVGLIAVLVVILLSR